MKSIIRRIPSLLDRGLTDTEQRHLKEHKLDPLWQDLKPMLADMCKVAGWDKLGAADEEGVDSYIRRLTALDPDSFSFRYRRTKKGVPSLPTEGLVNWDAAINKQWPLGEKKRVQFRAESFNLTKSATFDSPGVLFGTSGFGKVSSTARQPGRQIQFVLKFHF